MAEKKLSKRLERRFYAYLDIVTNVVSDTRLSDFLKVTGMENTEKPDGFDAYDLYDAVQYIKDNLNSELWDEVSILSECFETQHMAAFNLFTKGYTEAYSCDMHAISFHLEDKGYSYFRVDTKLIEAFIHNDGDVDLKAVSLIDIRQLHQHSVNRVNRQDDAMRFVQRREELVKEVERRGLDPKNILS